MSVIFFYPVALAAIATGRSSKIRLFALMCVCGPPAQNVKSCEKLKKFGSNTKSFKRVRSHKSDTAHVSYYIRVTQRTMKELLRYHI